MHHVSLSSTFEGMVVKLKYQRCDSYNTAQLQILSDPDGSREPVQVQDTAQSIAGSSSVSRSNSRGRSRYSATTLRRPTTSAPPSGGIQSILESTAWPDIRGRNAHSVAPATVPFLQSSPTASSNGDAGDSMDTDEDWESEMEFWGGSSPRSRLTSPTLDHEMAIDDDSEEEDGEDSADEDMSDDAEEDEADEYNRMDIFGHR